MLAVCLERVQGVSRVLRMAKVLGASAGGNSAAQQHPLSHFTL
jgi:hypothetical protein